MMVSIIVISNEYMRDRNSLVLASHDSDIVAILAQAIGILTVELRLLWYRYKIVSNKNGCDSSTYDNLH